MPTFQTYTFDATSTVRYLSNANTAISRSPTYGHLVLAPIMTASRTYAIDLGALNINGDFRVTPWATVGTRALTVNLGGTTTVASYRTTLLDPYASNTPSITFRTNGVAKGLITGFLLNSSDGGGSTLIASSTIILNGTSSTLFTNTGTLTLTGSTVDFDTDSSVTMLSGNFVGSSAFNKLELTPTITANRVYSLGAAASTTGNLLINPSSTGANTLEVDLGGWLDTAATATTTITGNGAGPATSLLDTTSSNHNLNSGHIDIQTNGTLKGNNSNITITGSGAGGTLFTRTGTFTADTSTVIMNPNVAVNLTGTTSVAFYSLNLSPTITTGRIYTFGNATTTLAGDFSITPSAGSAVALTVNLGAGLVGATNTTISIAPTGSATANLSTTASNFPIFTGDINIATGGTLTANASTITLVATSGTAFTRAGTFTAGTSEVVFASASSTLRGFAGNSTFYDLTVNAPNSVINSSTQDTTISHNLTVASGTLASGWGSFIGPGFGSGTFTLLGGATFCLGAPFDTTSLSCEGGSVDTTARIMPIFNTYNFSSTSTVRYLADADSIIATTTFGNLVLAPVLGASRTYTSSTTALAINGDLSLTPKASAGSTGLVFNLGSSLSASGTVLIQPDSTNSPTATLSTNGSSNNLSAGYINLQSNGTLQASSTVTLTGTSGTLLTNSGTATLTGSTVVVNPNASVTLVSGATTFDNLTLSPTITSGRTYSLGSSALTINGLWDINPTAGSFITFDVNLGGTVSGSSAITIRRGGSAVPTLSTTGSNHSLTAAKIDVQTGGTFSANASTVTLTGGSAWLDGNFLYRKKITFSASTVSTNLTDFPVLVNLTSSNFDFTKAQSGGQDIRFSDSDGSTALNYEIEKWNANTQLASVWVKVPQVNASSTNDYIYMYYGDSTAADGQNASGTWDSNFKAVWHLDENPAGSAPQMSDSSGNGNSATSNSMSSSDNIAGQIASSTRFGTGGASTKYLTKADNATLDLSTAGTIEAWVYAINANNGNGIIHKGQLHAFTDEAYSLQTYSGPGVDFYINAGGGTNTFLSGSTFSQNAWHHIVGTWDGTNAKIYIDGTLDASVGSTVSVLNSSGALQIGTQTLDSPSSEAWQGNLDDPRISDIARSAAWIRAEYLNGTNAFNTFGSEESAALFKLSGGSLSSSNSTIVMNPNATSTLTQGSFAGGNAFHNLQLSPTLSGSGKAYTFGTSTVEVGHDLTINPSAASPLTLTVNLGGDLNVNGSTTITRSGSALSTLDLLRSSAPQSNFGAFNLGIFSGGTLDATGASSTISINNIWLNSGGTFNAGSSTVVFNGYVGYLLGSSTAFYNLSASDSDNNTSDSVVYFQEMATTTVNNLFSAQGINDNDRINLYSTSAGVPWGLKIGTTGSTSISYAEPKDSDASPGLTIVHTNTNDGGNNINWNFAASGISYDTQWGSSGTGNGEFSSPYGVDVDANGYVYVVDSGNNRVQVFDADGNYLNQWGTSGSGDGEFNGPTGIAVDDANNVVYVMDTGNDRVQKFDTSGNYIDQWGVNGSGDGEFIDARDIALDRDGYVWVADRRNDRVQKFVDDGTYVAQYGVSGSGVGELSRPDDIAFISSGDGYITDEQNNRVVIIEPNTPSMLNEFGTGPGSGNGEFDSPTGITADALDYLFATEFNNNRFQQFDSSGSYVDQAGSPGSGNGEFSGPVGIALNDGANYIYVVDQGNNRVQRFTIERPYTITGRVYENDQTTPVGAGKTVALRINGVLTGTGDGGVGLDDTDSSGNFLFSDVVSTPTDPLVFYLTGETEKANNITVGNGVSSLSNVFLFDDHVVLGINYTGVTTIASTLTGYDSDQNDTDMLFDAEDAGTDTLVVEPGNELHLDYQALFYPGGDVTTPSMEIGTSALYSGATETLTLTATSGTLLTTGASATFAANSNTVIMNGDGNVTLTSSPSTLTFNKLQLTPSITGNRTYTFGSSAIVTTANFDITPTSTSANTLTVNMGANISVPSAATTTISGTGAGPASAVLDVRPSSTDYNLTTGHLVIGTNGTLDATGAASTITLRGTGTGSTLLTRVGTFTAGNSTVAVTPNVSVTINSGTVTFYNLSLVPTALSGTPKTYDFGSSAVTVNNDFTINPTAASSLGLLVNMGADMTVTGTTTITRTTSATSTLDLRPSSTDYNLTTGRLNIATGGTLDATGAASNITLTSTVASTTLFTNNGTFTAGNSTVIMNPAANVNLTSGTFTGSNAFYKLQLTPNINGSDRTYTFGGAASTTNNFDIKPTAAGSYTLTVNLGGWLDVAATATTTIGTTGISATAALLQTTSANSYALNSGHLDLSSVGILTANSSTVTLTGTQNNGILFTNAGTFNSGSSTVIMNPAATVRTISGTFTGSNAFYKLQLTPTTSGTISYTFLSAASTTGNFDINPNSSNSSLFFVNAGGAIDVATGATTTITRTGNASTFLDLRPSGADYDLYTGHLNIGTGATLDAGGSASTITVKGDWTKTGSFSQGNSTVRFSGSGAQTVNNSNTFYNLSITTSAARAITFASGATTTIASGGSAIFQGASGQLLTLQASAANSTPWYFSIPAGSSRTVSYTAGVDVTASDSAVTAANSTCTRTTNWSCDTLSFSISANTAYFGILSASATKYASTTPGGDTNEVVAHTITVSNDAANGYSLTVRGAPLTNNASSTIYLDYINGGLTPGFLQAGISQFGMRVAASGGSGTVSVPYSHGVKYGYGGTATTSSQVASASGTSAATTYSVYYGANIAPETPAGAYSTSLTYILTPTY
jgi:6-phosphogluconolactonase (cycloisomerase 2 family)